MNEKFILTIIDRFSAGPINELELGDGTYRLVLRKTSGGTIPQVQDEEITGVAAADSSVRLGISANTAVELPGGGEKITSPIVATFYTSPSPDSPPYVKAGSKVKAGQTLCILEAMKMMNHLEAEFDCEIIETHAGTGELVEYGQTLFTVKRL